MQQTRAMYRELTGTDLECSVYGKPYAVSYEYATSTLRKMAAAAGKVLVGNDLV